MTLFLGILIAIFIFSFIVIIHEIGHFSAARFFKVKVEEFGLGIPPRAKKIFTDKKGTLFSLNWLPLGGFVRLKGETPEVFFIYDSKKKLLSTTSILKNIETNTKMYDKRGEIVTLEEQREIQKILEKNNDPDNFSNAPLIGQIIIILGGIFMNFLLAFLIFFGLFLYGVQPIGINNQIQTNLEIKLLPTVDQALTSGILEKKEGVRVAPVKNSIAQKAGLKEGMIVTKINNTTTDSIESFIKSIKENTNTTIELQGFSIQENGEEKTFSIQVPVPQTGKIGTYIGENIQINKDFRYKYNFIDAGKYAVLETKNQVLLTFEALGILGQKIFFPKTSIERETAVKSVSGPIGIVDFISNSFSAGIIFLLIISALISINLGVFNLLPIPALDGGKLVFIVVNGCIEKVFGKKVVGALAENIIHFMFFILLIALSILIGYNDIIKILDK